MNLAIKSLALFEACDAVSLLTRLPALDDDFVLPSLDEPSTPMLPTVLVKGHAPKPTIVFDTYWRFAAERQAIYFRRLRGQPLTDGMWTHDPILRQYRFTNCYRAADRVSQYLIHEVQYRGDQSPREVVFRTLLFKIFNKVSTWRVFIDWLGRVPRASDLSTGPLMLALDRAKARKETLYSAAYMMPSPANAAVKHKAHLELLIEVVTDWEKLANAVSLEALYNLILTVPSFGPFLAFQYAIDLNYSSVFDFAESDFVVAGPGAKDGLRKCFADPGSYSEEDLIRWTCDRQEVEFDRLGLPFETLFGRRLQLIDIQNLYCEISKYARVAHPEIAGAAGRTKIKQKYCPNASPLSTLFFPPKWNLDVSSVVELS